VDVIRATDDEQLARSLWGSNCAWDDGRRQYVPTTVKPKEPAEVEAPAATARRRAGRKAAADGEA
jgi:hypothetical protein